MTIPAKTQPAPSTIEDVITRGDLSKLTPEQRTEFYIRLCKRHGLDELTQPFDWLWLNGRLVLYANRRCADQLRKINGIHINLVSQDKADGLLTIHVKAKDKDGREDEDLGVVSLPDTLKGDARANTILKAVTKAKRRVTLSISGLGFLDETEVEDIPEGAKREPAITPPTPAAAALVEIAAASQEYVDYQKKEVATDKPFDWKAFGEQILEQAKQANIATPEQTAKLEEMKAAKPKSYKNLMAALDKIDTEREENQPKPEDDPDAYRVWLIDQMSRYGTAADLNQFMQRQQLLWEPCFPPDIEDWTDLFKERAGELGS
jgi:hypothetical protein